MPNVTITVTVTTGQWDRVKAALNFETPGDAVAWIKGVWKGEVRAAETGKVMAAKRAAVNAEDWIT